MSLLYKCDELSSEISFEADWQYAFPVIDYEYTPETTFEESSLKDEFEHLFESMQTLRETVFNDDTPAINVSMSYILSILATTKKQIINQKISTDFIIGFCRDSDFLEVVQKVFSDPNPLMLPLLLKILAIFSSFPRVFDYLSSEFDMALELSSVLALDVPAEIIYNIITLLMSYIKPYAKHDPTFQGIIDNLPADFAHLKSGIGAEWCFFLVSALFRNSTTLNYEQIMEYLQPYLNYAAPNPKYGTSTYTRLAEVSIQMLKNDPSLISLLFNYEIPQLLIQCFGNGSMSDIEKMKTITFLIILLNRTKEENSELISSTISLIFEHIPGEELIRIYQRAIPQENEKKDTIKRPSYYDEINTSMRERCSIVQLFNNISVCDPINFPSWIDINFILSVVIPASFDIGQAHEKEMVIILLDILINQYWDGVKDWCANNIFIVSTVAQLFDPESAKQETNYAIIDFLATVYQRSASDPSFQAGVVKEIEDSRIIDSFEDFESGDNDEINQKLQFIIQLFQEI